MPVVGPHDAAQQEQEDAGRQDRPVGRPPERGEERRSVALIGDLRLLDQLGLVPRSRPLGYEQGGVHHVVDLDARP